MDVRLPNGNVIRGVPEGTLRDEVMAKAIQAGLATAEDFGQQPTQEAPQQTAIAEPETATAEPTRRRGGGRSGQVEQLRAERDAAFEALSPEEKQLVEDLSPLDAFRIGMGRGFYTVGRGVGLLDPEEETVTRGMEQLKGVYPTATGGGELVGETAPFLLPGGAVSAVPKGLARTAAAGALGATEGAVISRGLGGSDEEIAAATTLGGILGAGLEVALPRLSRVGRRIIRRQLGREPAEEVLDAAGNPSQELAEALEQSGQSLDDLARQADVAPARAAEAPVLNVPRLPQRRSRREAAQMLERGERLAPTGRFELAPRVAGEAPRVQLVPEYAEAVRQGFDEGIIAMTGRGSQADVKAMQRMVAARQQQRIDPLAAGRATDVAGESLAQRVTYVANQNRAAGRQIDEVAQSLRGQRVDMAEPVEDFLGELRGLGVTVTDDGLEFAGSSLEGRNLAGARDTIETIYNRLMRGIDDANAAHSLKRAIDQQVTYGKSQAGLAGDAEQVLKGLRRSIDQRLDESFPAYDAVNTQYKETLDALDAIQGALGRKIDFNSARSSEAMGTRLRALWSNQQGRIPMEDAIDMLDGVARDYGGQFDTDVRILSRFAQELDRVFGSEAPTSLKGQIEQGIPNIPPSTTAAIVEGGKAAYDRVRGVNPENQFKAITDALNRRSAAQ